MQYKTKKIEKKPQNPHEQKEVLPIWIIQIQTALLSQIYCRATVNELRCVRQRL